MTARIPLGLFTAVGVGLVASLLLVPVAIWCGNKLGLLDHPDGDRRIHKRAVPRTGGVAVFLAAGLAAGFALFAAGFPQSDVMSVGVVASIALVLAVGVLDDWRGMPPIGKLIVQIAAAYVAIYYGVRIDRIALAPDISFSTGVFAVPLTLLWLVAITNAFNLVDGIDGLASSVGIVACIALAWADLYLGAGRSAVCAFAIVGAALGFVRYNRSPAQVFLGDAGSMGIGFSLGLLSITAATDANRNTYMLVPIFALAYPIIDTSIAIARRWLRGHPLSRADGRHVHHRLLAMQLTPGRAVAMLTVMFAFVAAAGVLVSFAPPQLTLALFVGTAVFFFVAAVYAVRWLQYTEFVELGAAFLSVLFKGRTVLQDKIRAGDLAEQIAASESFEQLQATIAEAGGELRVMSMELLYNDARTRTTSLQVAAGTPPCRLDYHLLVGESDRHGDLLLRIWSARDNNVYGRPSAERIAARIGPAVEKWLADHPEAARRLAGAQRRAESGAPGSQTSHGLRA